MPGSERWPRHWGTAKGQVWFPSKLETTVNVLTGNAHVNQLQNWVHPELWIQKLEIQTVSTENPPVCNNKTPVLSYTKRSKKKKINIPCYVCKAESKTQFCMFPNHLALYSLLTLCREGNGCVSKAESSSSLKDARKKYKILN